MFGHDAQRSGRCNSSEQKRPYSRVLYLILFDTRHNSLENESVTLYSKSIYIKMNRRSLVSLKFKNGSTDLNNYFFILFALLQGWFKKKKKSEKLSGKLENSGKTESAFFCGNGWNDLANFFF
jgi:hypothetical protein